MTHKEEVKLNRFLTKCQAMEDIALCMLGDNGRWHNGTGKEKLVYEVDKAEISDTKVVLAGSFGHKFNIKIGGEWKKPMELTDKELEEIIDAKFKMVKAKKAKEEAKKAKSEKKVEKKVKKAEKKKAKLKKDDYTNTTYLDVYKRVVDIMHDKTGYAPDRDIKDEENEEIAICLDFDGNEQKYWSNAKAFVGGDPDEESIFEVVADLYAKYEKLASRWDAEFADHCSILGEVDVEDTSPAGIMKALDKAGL